MARVKTWNPFLNPVQGGLKEGKFASSTHTLIAAGPPHLSEVSVDGKESVFPVGLCQDFGWGQTKGIARFFEIGSKRSYVVSGHAAGGLNLSEVYYSGPSLLRKLFGVWPDAQGKKLWSTNAAVDSPQNPGFTKNNLQVVPGYNNFLYNLQSEFFDRPFGLMLIVKTNLNDVIINAYFEEAMVPGHNIAFNAQGVVLQESCTVDYERVVPVVSNYEALLSEIQDLPY